MNGVVDRNEFYKFLKYEFLAGFKLLYKSGLILGTGLV